jgi:hypothetical protein
LIISTTVTLASSNNALPDGGDCTETCRSCFSANFNVNFKTVLRQFTCASVGEYKNFDDIKMHGMYVKKMVYVYVCVFLGGRGFTPVMGFNALADSRHASHCLA